MKSKKTLALLFVLLVAATVGALLTIAARRRAAHARRFTAEARGVVTETDFNNYRTGRVTRERLDAIVDEAAGMRRRTTRIKYRYDAGDREIESQTFERGDRRADYPTGAQVKVCYDPRYPQESMLVAPEAACGAP